MSLVKVFFKKNIGKYSIGTEASVASGYMRNYLYPKGICEYSVNVELIEQIKSQITSLIKKDLEEREKTASALEYLGLLKCIIMVEKATDNSILYKAVRERNIIAACVKNLSTYHSVHIKSSSINKLDKSMDVKYIKMCGVYNIVFNKSQKNPINIPVVVSNTRSGAINMIIKHGILSEEEAKKIYDLKLFSSKLIESAESENTEA